MQGNEIASDSSADMKSPLPVSLPGAGEQAALPRSYDLQDNPLTANTISMDCDANNRSIIKKRPRGTPPSASANNSSLSSDDSDYTWFEEGVEYTKADYKVVPGHIPRKSNATGLTQKPGETLQHFKKRTSTAGRRRQMANPIKKIRGPESITATAFATTTTQSTGSPNDSVAFLKKELDRERNIRIAQAEQLKKLQEQLATITKHLETANKNQEQLRRTLQNLQQTPASQQRAAVQDQTQPNQEPHRCDGPTLDAITTVVKELLAPILKSIGQATTPIATKKSQQQPEKHTTQETTNKNPRRWEKPPHNNDFPPLPRSQTATRSANKPTTKTGTSRDTGEVGRAKHAPAPKNRSQLQPPAPPLKRKNKNPGILLIPTQPGTRALDELKNNSTIKPREINIKQTVQFPSGAVLLKVGSQDEVDSIKRQLADNPGVKPKEEKTFPVKVTIHRVDAQTTPEELQQDIRKRYGEEANSVSFTEYHNNQHAGSKIAYLEISNTLHTKMQKSPTLRVGYERLRIDFSIRPNRCNNCHLLGHRQIHCRNRGRNSPTATEPCLDCSTFNAAIRTAKLPKSRQLATDHPTNHGHCPVKKRLIAKHSRQQAHHTSPPITTCNTQEQTSTMEIVIGGTIPTQHTNKHHNDT